MCKLQLLQSFLSMNPLPKVFNLLQVKLHFVVLDKVQYFLVIIPCDHFWDILLCIPLDQYKNQISFNFQASLKHRGACVSQESFPAISFALFPYRVSCTDQQGQTYPLIRETTVENESKMKPITTRP